jgi:hypothetical protein
LKTRLIVLSVALLAIAAPATGCGGGGDESSQASSSQAASEGGTAEAGATTSPGPAEPVTTSSMSKAGVIKAAESACRQTRKGLVEEEEDFVSKHLGDNLEQDELLADVTREVLVPRIEAEIEAIHETGAPAGDEKQIEAILVAQQEAVEDLAGQKKIEDIKEVDTFFAKSNGLRRAYGLPVCSYIP